LSDAPTYIRSVAGETALRQGEVISALNLFQVTSDNLAEGNSHKIIPISTPYAIAMTPDCDLDWDYKAQFGTEEEKKRHEAKLVFHILFCEARDAQQAKSQLKQGQWNQISKNNHERYQYLEKAPPEIDANGSGVPALIIDFKRYFTIQNADVYAQLSQTAKRHCFLGSPYLQHLVTRFYYFQYRVCLQRDHSIE